MGTLEPQSELSAEPQSKQDPEPDLEFRIVPLCMPLHVPFVTAHRRVTDAADQLFLFEALGTCGFGSAAPTLQLTGEWSNGIQSFWKDVAWPGMRGALSGWVRVAQKENAFAKCLLLSTLEILERVQTLAPHNMSAKAGLECALLDWLAKRLNTSLEEVLCKLWASQHEKFNLEAESQFGSFDKSSLPLSHLSRAERISSATISLGTPEQSRDQLRQLWSMGYRCFKVKVSGNHSDEQLRLDLLMKVCTELAWREGFGDDPGASFRFRLDANESFLVQSDAEFEKSKEQIWWLENLMGERLELIEQPFSRDFPNRTFELSQLIQTPIFADESVFRLKDLQSVGPLPGCKGVVVKLTKAGGPFQALKWLEQCSRLELVPMLSCMLESPVSLTAALHVVGAWHQLGVRKSQHRTKSDGLSETLTENGSEAFVPKQILSEVLCDLDAVDLIKEHPFVSPWERRVGVFLPQVGLVRGLGVEWKKASFTEPPGQGDRGGDPT